MKRVIPPRRIGVVALIATLLWSLTFVTAVSPSTSIKHERAAKVTLARLAEGKATAGPNGVLIQWRTSFELDNLGFNLYREQSGLRTLINPAIIAGSALIAGQGTPLYAGFSYQWFDPAGGRDSAYYLEDLDLNGTRTMTGPIRPSWDQSLKQAQDSKTISEAVPQTPESSQTGSPATIFDQPEVVPVAISDQWVIASQPGLKLGVKQNGWYRVTQPELTSAGFDVTSDSINLRLFVAGRETPIAVSRASGPLSATDFIEFYGIGIDLPTTDTRVYYLVNGSQPGLRLSVTGEIRVDSEPTPSPVTSTPITQIADTKRFLNIDLWPLSNSRSAKFSEEKKNERPSEIQRSTEKPPLFEFRLDPAPIPDVKSGNTEPNSISPKTSESVELPVKSVREALTIPKQPLSALPRSRSYRHKQYPRRKKSHRKSAKRNRNHAVPVANPVAGFLYTSELKERAVYFTALLNGDAENFFGQGITAAPVVQTLVLNGVQTDSTGTARLDVAIQGASSQAHLVSVFLNEILVGTVSFSFQVRQQQTFFVSPSQLREGANTIKFVQGDTGDVSLVDYVRITYPRVFRAAADSLSFSAKSTQDTTIAGFATPDIRVLDISDPFAVQEVHTVIQPAGGGYSATVPASAARSKSARTFLALPMASFLHPASIISNQPSTLNQSGNAGDLLIISHRNFLPSLATLVAQRQAQGFTVRALDIEDIFDEFSYGLHTPQAIKDFLTRAVAQWSKPPRYVLLVGDGSFDPRDYSHLGSFDFVPTKLVDTFYMETASDDTLSDFDNDGIPEIPVGRLPVRTVAEADRAIAKIVNFSPASVPQTALMVADAQGSYYFDFEKADDQVSALLPPGMTVQKVYRRLEPSDAAARANIISKINSGAALVNYSGHGNVDVWTGAPIFSGSDAMALTNGNKLPLVIVMDCLNGYFVPPNIDCIGESLMKAPNGGAVASFASSGLTIPDGQHLMGKQLFQALYGGPSMALGDATRQAKAATTDLDVRRSWILFGDPSMKIR